MPVENVSNPFLIGTLFLPAAGPLPAVDFPTLARDAADNVFSGQNYSSTSLTTRPDGSTVTISGQADHSNVSLSIQDGTTNRNRIALRGAPCLISSPRR